MDKRHEQTFQLKEYMDGKCKMFNIISGQKFKLNLQRNHFAPITAVKMKDRENSKGWEEAEKGGPTLLVGEQKWYNYSGKWFDSLF